MKKNLLQRLLPPPGFSAFSGIGTFRGIPKEVLEELFKICNFDYMGDSEYENGKISKSFYYIFENRSNIKLFQKEIAGLSFYILIDPVKLEEYSQKIKDWSADNYDSHGEYHGLNDIVGSKPNDRKITGWLDLDDNVMFFISTEEGQLMASNFEKAFILDN